MKSVVWWRRPALSRLFMLLDMPACPLLDPVPLQNSMEGLRAALWRGLQVRARSRFMSARLLYWRVVAGSAR